MGAFHGLYGLIVSLGRSLDGVASLLLRLILAPVLFASGWEKLNGENWFMHTMDSFPFPFNVIPPEISWQLATWTELVGGVCLLIGLAVRWVSIPAMVVMFVAAWSVHLDNGWPAIAPSFPDEICIEGTEAATESSLPDRIARCYNVNQRTIEASQRLARGRAIMTEHGNSQWLNEYGPFVKLNNGIEFAAMYFAMLFALWTIGGGRWFSLDYWIALLSGNSNRY
ncbi:MAG: DoxX family protein [Gammaproteobacteria bacterium]|nr:DoxX family protein [Gammaproteobacteria bacterium]